MNAFEEKIANIREASKQLNALANQIYSFDDSRYASENEEFNRQIIEAANGLSDFANAQEKLMEITRDMAEMSNSFNIAYLELQEKMLRIDKKLAAMSYFMRDRQEKARTIINSVR